MISAPIVAILLVVTCVCLVACGGLIIRWLSSRPDPRGTLEAVDRSIEMDSVFVHRESITFVSTIEYLPLVLEALHLAVNSGFEQRHIDTLLHRIETHRAFEHRQAVYAVSDMHGESSDLEFHWMRDEEDHVKMIIKAVPNLVRVARKKLDEIPSAS